MQLSSISISPKNLDAFSRSLDIKNSDIFSYFVEGFSEILVKSAIFKAFISTEKYHKISLNFFSEILERTIYLF